MANIDDVNRHPVIHTWSYKLEDAACYDSNQENADLVRRSVLDLSYIRHKSVAKSHLKAN
jgi:hypothetical protein